MYNINIKEAISENINDILKLLTQLGDGSPSQSDNAVETVEVEKVLNKMRKYPFYKIYLAHLDEKVIGIFSLLIVDNIGRTCKPIGIVDNVVVNVEFRRKGIGRNMMEYAKKICSENDCYKIILSSNLKRIEAHEFYEALGYKKHGYSFKYNL